MSNISSFVKRLRDIMRNDPGINGDAQRIEQIAWLLFLKVYDAKDTEWKASDKSYTSIIPDEIQWKNWAHEDKGGEGLTGDELLNFVNNTVFPKLKSLKVSKETEIRKAIVFTTFSDANKYMKDGVLLRQVINVIDEIDFSDYEESHAFGEIYESILKELQSAGSSGEFYTPRAVTDFMAKMIQPKIGEKMADFACGTGGFITSWLKQLSERVATADDQKKYAESVYGIEKKQFPYMLCVTNLLLHDVDNPQVYHDNSLQYDVLNYTDDDRFDVILMNPPYGGSEKNDIKNHFPDDVASSETADLFMSVIMYRLKRNGRVAVIIPDGFLFGNDNAKSNIKKRLLTEFNLHTIVRLPGSVFSPYTSITTNILFFNYEEPTGKTWFYRVDIPSDRKHFSKTKPMELKHFDDCMAWWNKREEILDADGNPKAKCYTAKELADGGYNLDLCGYPHEEEEILSISDTLTLFNEKKDSRFNDLEEILSQMSKMHESLKLGMPIEEIDYSHIKKIDFSFLLDYGSCVKKAILQEAIQGKLVPQDAKEGSATDLLKQIEAEKARLIKDGKLKKEKPLPPITDEEKPFEIPENWCWCRLGEIFQIIMGQSPEGVNIGETIKGMEFHQGKVFFTDKYLAKSNQQTCEITKVAEPNSILLCMRAPVGKVNLTKRQICIGRGLSSVVPLGEIDVEWAYYLFETLENDFVKKSTGSTFKAITGDIVKEEVIPLPPLSEQKRIVSALEKMLPLCEKIGR